MPTTSTYAATEDELHRLFNAERGPPLVVFITAQMKGAGTSRSNASCARWVPVRVADLEILCQVTSAWHQYVDLY